jgi:hypothetical protein
MNGGEMAWNRETPWRQGHFISRKAVKALKLLDSKITESSCAVVISHDCDLVQDIQVEPYVEVIAGRIVPKGDGNYYWAKSPRTLHIEMQKNGTPAVVELNATGKRIIAKEDLAPFLPEPEHSFPRDSLIALRAWLSLRYSRDAFPDRFVEIMKDSGVDTRLVKILKTTGSLLSDVFFDLDEGRLESHADGSPYSLKVVLVHPPGEFPEQTANKVGIIETTISDLFEKKCFDQQTEQWNGIALKQCMSISEDDLSVGQAKKLKQWRLEHLSLRNGVVQ